MCVGSCFKTLAVILVSDRFFNIVPSFCYSHCVCVRVCVRACVRTYVCVCVCFHIIPYEKIFW